MRCRNDSEVQECTGEECGGSVAGAGKSFGGVRGCSVVCVKCAVGS